MPDFLLENKHTQTHLNNPLIKDLFVNTGSNVVIFSQALVSGNITLVRLNILQNELVTVRVNIVSIMIL